jgi:hypothetical protein
MCDRKTKAQKVNEDQRKYLEMIQAVISRLSSNSFLLKGWSVTLASALLGYASTQRNDLIASLTLLPALVFWALDAYYLAQERLHRDLFDKARKGRSEIYAFDISPLSRRKWRLAAMRPTTCVLHGAVVGVAILLIFIW